MLIGRTGKGLRRSATSAVVRLIGFVFASVMVVSLLTQNQNWHELSEVALWFMFRGAMENIYEQGTTRNAWHCSQQ